MSATLKQFRVQFLILLVVCAAAGFLWYSQVSGVAACERQGSGAAKKECWDTLLRAETRDKGIDAAFKTLSSLYGADPTFATDCHIYTHSIGEEAYKIFSAKHALPLSPLTSMCGYGFYHGFLEQLLFTTGSLDEARDFCAYADTALSGQRSTGAAYACYHGWGHGLTDGSDISAWGNPDAMTKPSLQLCTKLATNDFELSRCATGVFNALETLSQDPKYKLGALSQDPFSVCSSQPHIYREPCYTNMVPAVLRLEHDDFAAAAAYIRKHILLPDEPTSIPGGGTTEETVILALFDEFMRIYITDADYAEQGVTLCRSLPENLHLSCIEGLASGHMKYGKPQEEYVKAFAFCKNGFLTDAEHNACFRYILPRLAIWYAPEKVKELCALAGEPYTDRYCKKTP